MALDGDERSLSRSVRFSLGKSLAPIVYLTGCACELVWTVLEKRKLLAFAGIRASTVHLVGACRTTKYDKCL